MRRLPILSNLAAIFRNRAGSCRRRPRSAPTARRTCPCRRLEGCGDGGDLAFDRRRDDRLGSGEFVACQRQQSRQRAGAGTARRSGRAIAPSPRRPFRHDAQAARKTGGAEAAPEGGAIATASAPVGVRPVEIRFDGAGSWTERLTSCLELALAPPASDAAHQAFSKLFLQTELDSDGATLIATRRRRSMDEAEIWVPHLAVVEGVETAPGAWETDRARFIGRDRDAGDSAALSAPLSGVLGTVLDPAFALRRRVL
ncbi:MAG: hypothetical protein CVT86_07890, partial [Alphaproteobacteria bacterium HGW-Alphaproteobacteria-8]